MRRSTLLLLIGLAFAPTSHAATLTVTNLNDVAAGSLRQALLDYAPGDTIKFAAGLSGTIVNGGAPYHLTRTVTIDGPGDSVLAISGADARQLFILTDGEVRISGL